MRGTHRWCPQRPSTSMHRVALRYAAHGWPVVPGTFAGSAAGPHDCERVACLARGAHPAVPDWRHAATVEPGRIGAWWARGGYVIVLPTGTAFDVVEVHADLGTAARELLVDRCGRPAAPIAVTPDGRWQVLVRPGTPLRADLADRVGVVLHGAGSWVLGPPSALPTGTVRWLVSPRAVNWTPADPHAVQRALSALVR